MGEDAFQLRKQLISFCAYLVVADVYPGAHAAIKGESRGMLDVRQHEGAVRYQIGKLKKEEILLAKTSAPEQFKTLVVVARRDAIWAKMPITEEAASKPKAKMADNAADSPDWAQLTGLKKYQVRYPPTPANQYLTVRR